MQQKLIRAHDNANRPILAGGGGFLPRVYFNLLKVKAGQNLEVAVPGFEAVLVVRSGRVDIKVGSGTFADVYHPTVTSPGHEEYILTILVGHHQRSLVQYFKDEYQPLMGAFPGVQDMVDKFK